MRLKKILQQIAELTQTTRYVRFVKRPVAPKDVLLGSESKTAPGGRMLRILRELTGGAYREYRLYLAVRGGEAQRYRRALGDGASRLRFVKYGSPAHCRLLASAGYLITDTAFPERFVKRPGQVCVAALEARTRDALGRESAEGTCFMGNVQRSLLTADYLLFPDARTKERIKSAYDLDGLFEGTYLWDADPGVMCRRIFYPEEKTAVRAERGARDEKKKILFYVGGLKRNGITTALLNLLQYLDLREYRYYAAFQEEYLADDPSRLELLPGELGAAAISGGWYMTFSEAAAGFLYYKCGLNRPLIRKRLERFYRREYRRDFGGAAFDWCIHFTGYERKMTGLLQEAPCKRMIFVHNDMLMEVKCKGNHHLPTLLSAYRSYDVVAAVSQDISDRIRGICPDRSRLHVVPNCHDYERVRSRAEEQIVFDASTICTVTSEELAMRLAEKRLQKIITIGRFSWEKGHDMLLEAYAAYAKECPESLLVIIGGEGNLYEETWERAKKLGLAGRVILLKSIANPMPILRACDLFVLSSRYEGLGLVILEADTLGVPVISTDVVGPSGFMKEHGGYLVPPDPHGILEGMRAFGRGEVPLMRVDYELLNRKAASGFLRLISEDCTDVS